jgi:hypothetical protein
MAVTQHSERTEDVCYDVLRAVADCRGIEPTEIDEQLSAVVDPDSLASLWGTEVPSGRTVNGALSFEFYGCRVTLTSDGRIEAKHL